MHSFALVLLQKSTLQHFSFSEFTDSFEVGFDIQHYYALHQSLTLEDLAKASSKHTLKGLVKVINKVSTFLSFNQGTFESPLEILFVFNSDGLMGLKLPFSAIKLIEDFLLETVYL